jgi:hypothetical protein
MTVIKDGVLRGQISGVGIQPGIDVFGAASENGI